MNPVPKVTNIPELVSEDSDRSSKDTPVSTSDSTSGPCLPTPEATPDPPPALDPPPPQIPQPERASRTTIGDVTESHIVEGKRARKPI